MKFTKLRVVLLSLPLVFSLVCSQEPPGGTLTDLVFFDDAINAKARFRAYGNTGNFVDQSVKHSGSASYRSDFSNFAGMQIFWYGTVNDGPKWEGPDTAVFWAQPTSRLQMWVRSSVADNGNMGITMLDNLGSNLGTLYEAPIPNANVWFQIDVAIPPSMRNLPLKRIDISVGPAAKVFWIDDFRVTNVRLYAGRGPLSSANMSHIAVSQIGFAPQMKKQFSSPVEFSSFEVKRVSDGATVFTGSGVVRVDSDAIIDGTVWIGDFSALTTPGRYKIVAGGKESYPFDIRQEAFDQATRAVQRFFYYQRAFTAIEQQYAEGPWFRPSDADKAPPGVVKGWHDAGDLTVYNATMTQSLYWFMETWLDFRPTDDATNIPESGNGIPDLLDEARWGLEWVLSMQEPAGGFWSNTTAANGSNSYVYGLTFPHTVDPYINTVPPCVQATAKAVAVLAYASSVYRPFSPTFADSCLAAARRGWNWIQANPNATNDGSPNGGLYFNNYSQGNDNALLRSNKAWAAASMLYATGESQFVSAFEANYDRVPTIGSYSRSEAFAASMYLRATTGTTPQRKNEIKREIFALADQHRREADEHPFQFATAYYWGSTSNGMHMSGNFFWKAYLLDSTRLADRYQALQNIDYIFGRNYLNQCYVSGIDGVSKPRLRGFHHWMKALNATPWHFPGALAGGPNQSPDGNDRSYPDTRPYPIWGYWGDTSNPKEGRVPVDGRFTDNDSWSTNEIVVNWNAPLLYNLYGAKALAAGGPLPVLPTGSFNAAPDSLPEYGGTVTLSWTSAGAQSASIDAGIGSVPLTGSQSVDVRKTTTFTLTLSNDFGSQTFFARVRVGADDALPKDFFLSQNYPNPFNPSTTIVVSVPRTSKVNVTIYNMLGQRVRTLFDGNLEQGKKELQWDGTNDSGVKLGSGVYIYTMKSGNFIDSLKMTLTK